MKEEIEQVFNKHKQITKEPWVLIIAMLLFFGNGNKITNAEELDDLLTRLEKGEIDILKEGQNE